MEIGWLLVGAAVIVAIAFVRWDNRQMTRQAERDARSVRPFPDLDKHKEWENAG